MPSRTAAVEPLSFDTYAAMERQVEASRQLRAETVADAVASAIATLLGRVRRVTLRITDGTPI